MKIIRFLILLSFMAILGAAMWWGVEHSDLTKIKEIQIRGVSASAQERLRKIITIKPGDSFWTESISIQAQLLKTDPWVENAKVERVFPSTILIDIKERVPAAVVGNKRGQFQFVGDDNNIIDTVKNQKMTGYPVIWGEEFQSDNALRGQALTLLRSLPKLGPLSREDLSDIQYDEDRGFQIRLSKSGILVDVGKENLPLHIDRARRVVQYLDQHRINASRVDSDYAKKVLVKVRKGR